MEFVASQQFQIDRREEKEREKKAGESAALAESKKWFSEVIFYFAFGGTALV
jgi:hypothetical protein